VQSYDDAGKIMTAMPTGQEIKTAGARFHILICNPSYHCATIKTYNFIRRILVMPGECVTHKTEPVFIDMGHKHLINLNNVTSIQLIKNASKEDVASFHLVDGATLLFHIKDCSSISELLDNLVKYYQSVEG
jgi:hypothetical protein